MNPFVSQKDTAIGQQNNYLMHVPLFVMDVVRMFQDHPKYKTGIKQSDIVDIFCQENFANGDLDAQIELAVANLESIGYLRYIDGGYRTLGPLARLTIAKSPKQQAAVWEKIKKKF